jgi:hypothetical protein
MESIQSHDVSANSFDELANVIKSGLYARENTPVERLRDTIDFMINTKRYEDQFANTEMKVVDFRDDTLHVKSGNKGEFLKEGMKFKIVANRRSVSGDEVEQVSEPVGIAEVTLASRATTKMRVLRWDVPTDQDNIEEMRRNELKGKQISVDVIIPDELEGVKIEDLEETRNELSTTTMAPELEDND